MRLTPIIIIRSCKRRTKFKSNTKLIFLHISCPGHRNNLSPYTQTVFSVQTLHGGYHWMTWQAPGQALSSRRILRPTSVRIIIVQWILHQHSWILWTYLQGNGLQMHAQERWPSGKWCWISVYSMYVSTTTHRATRCFKLLVIIILLYTDCHSRKRLRVSWQRELTVALWTACLGICLPTLWRE